MRAMSVKSRGKISKGNSFPTRENQEQFPFPCQSEKHENYREFPFEGKSRENTEIFRGKGNAIYITYTFSVSLTGQRGKERRA